MASYSKAERLVAKLLEATPWLRDMVRWSYKRLIYLLHRRPGFSYSIPDKSNLKSPYQILGIKEVEDEDLFFGYYDKSPWNKSMSKMVFHSSADSDQIQIKLFDLENKTVEVIGQSETWNYQQGSMTQWVNDETIIFNVLLDDNKLGSRLYNISEDKTIDYKMPIQCVHPNGKSAISLNYCRLMWLRPDYGYAQAFSNFERNMDYKEDGLWQINLENGQFSLLISIEELILYRTTPEMAKSNHKFNHVMYSPNGDNLIFMHRWLGTLGKWSRLYLYNLKSKTFKLLMDDKMISHYSWRCNVEVIVWGRHQNNDGYYIVNTENGKIESVSEGYYDQYGDGHPTFNPKNKNEYVTDTYPDKSRVRHLLVNACDSNHQSKLGQFFSSWKFEDEERCDLHPRWSPDGNFISIDSAHTGRRKSYILKI